MAGVCVIGGGGHAKVCIATLRAAGHRVSGIYDDNEALHGKTLLGVPVKGGLAKATQKRRKAVLGVGDNRVRKRLAEMLDLEWVSVVHPRAVVDESVNIGAGTVVFAGAVIQPDARVGCHAILNTLCGVDHDCAIGDFAHVGPGAHLCGGISLGEGGLVGVGASATPGVALGPWSIVGAGAAVISDVPAQSLYVGVPARLKPGQ